MNPHPLAFMEQSRRNRTPNKLPAAEREACFAMCDKALVDWWIVSLTPSADSPKLPPIVHAKSFKTLRWSDPSGRTQ